MENKPKFTSGPWEAQGGLVSVVDGKIITDIRPRPITPEEEARANAVLISAAPEMYEILNEVEEASRYRRPIKKATWLKVCEILKRVDGRNR